MMKTVMNQELLQSETSEQRRKNLHRDAVGRVCRLSLKELREILRDRRTLITLVLMPLIIYPLLALVFQRFLLTSLSPEATTEYVYGFESEQDAQQVMTLVQQGGELLKAQAQRSKPSWRQTGGSAAADLSPANIKWLEINAQDADSLVAGGVVHVAVVIRRDHEKTRGGDGSDPMTATLQCEFLHRSGSPMSEAALNHLDHRLRVLNDHFLRRQLSEAGVTARVPIRTDHRAVDLKDEAPFSLAALLPLILVLMTVTGAVYPAIDLTAGERERGTLETLIAAPVPRLGLLLAKYVAVLTVAVLTAVVNLTGMVVTARSTGLDALLLGSAGMTPAIVLKVLGLLVLFAAFFSAVLLALTSYARSFKEAQAYIIPLMLVCLMPGIVCLLPGLEFGGALAVTPLVNIVLLARDLLEGNVEGTLAAAAVVSTAFYVFGAIAIAAHIFGTDAILYGGQGWPSFSFSDLPRKESVSVSTALTCLAALFPAYFVMSSLLARHGFASVSSKLVACAAGTVLLFAGVPLLVASLGRVNLRPGLRLRRPTLWATLAAGLLGLTLWPLAYEIVLCQRLIGIDALGLEQLASVKQLLGEMPRISPWLLVATLAITPAICEELFFRGFLLSALRAATSASAAVLVSALLFGLFHVVTATILSEWRFLPSTFLGLVLGWVCLRSGSVVPGMVLHALHNGFLVMLAHYQDRLAAWGIGEIDQVHLPISWIVLSIVGITGGTSILMLSRPPFLTDSQRSAHPDRFRQG